MGGSIHDQNIPKEIREMSKHRNVMKPVIISANDVMLNAMVPGNLKRSFFEMAFVEPTTGEITKRLSTEEAAELCENLPKNKAIALVLRPDAAEKLGYKA